MKYVEFFKALASGTASGIYLFDSEEEYLNTSLIEEAEKQINIKDFNLIKIKEDVDFETIKNSYETYPVMEDKKIIIWTNVDFSREKIKSYDHILEPLTKDMENFPDYAIFMIFPNGKAFKGKFYKNVKKYGNIVEIDRLNNKELRSFIGKRFIKNNKKISNANIDKIIERFSYLTYNSQINLFDIVNTVDKIISNSPDQIIDERDIDDQLDQILNLNIFNLTDGISQKNMKDGVKTLLHMEKAGEDLFMIYHMIIRQIRILTCVKSLLDGFYNDSFIMKTAKIGAYELRKSKNFVNNFTIDELLDINDRLMDMEIRQKSQDFDMRDELIKLIAFIGK